MQSITSYQAEILLAADFGWAAPLGLSQQIDIPYWRPSRALESTADYLNDQRTIRQ
jgi:hypothetical protein